MLMVRPPRLRRHLADRPPADLPRIDVPTLMVHGTEDRILPIDSTARRLPELIADCTLIEIDDGPTCTGSASSTDSPALGMSWAACCASTSACIGPPVSWRTTKAWSDTARRS